MINRLLTSIKDNWSYSLYALVPVLSLFNSNSDEVPYSAIIRPLVVLNLITILVIFLIRFIGKDRIRINALIQVTLLFLFSFNFYELLKISSYFHLLVVFILTLFVLKAKSFYVEKFSTWVFRLFAILALSNVMYLAYNFVNHQRTIAKNDNFISTVDPKNVTNKPDIYLIVLDGHARADILKNQYNYDNSDFLHALSERGFYVQSDAITNYGQTHLAIPSLLDMNYLDPPADHPITASEKVTYSINKLKSNATFTLFNSFGYKMVLYSTGWAGSSFLSEGPWTSSMRWAVGEFEYSLMSTSALYSLVDRNFLKEIYRNNIVFVFNDVPNVTTMSEPTLMYAHILSPHPPFVFGEGNEDSGFSKVFTFLEGDEVLNGKDGSQYHKFYKDPYVSQLKEIDNMSLEMIDKILNNSPQPPVIILMSDHGPASAFTYENLSDDGLRERYSVLRAIYFPDKNYEQISKINSHINVFRVILNQYFGGNYSLLDDRKIYHSTRDIPYVFEEKTDIYYK